MDPTPELDRDESNIISSSFGISSENQPNEDISKMALNHLLKHWEQSNTQLHPSYTDISPSEQISIMICCIILKYNNFTDIYFQIYTQMIARCRALYVCFTYSIYQNVNLMFNRIINNDPYYIMKYHLQ